MTDGFADRVEANAPAAARSRRQELADYLAQRPTSPRFVKLSDDDVSAEVLAAAAWDTTAPRVEVYGAWAEQPIETKTRQTEAARRSIRLLLERAAP